MFHVGGLSLWCRTQELGCLMWATFLTSQVVSTFLRSFLFVGCRTGGGVQVRACLCFSYLSPCCLFPLLWRYCPSSFLNSSKEIIPHTAVGLWCLWEVVSSGSSYTSILSKNLLRNTPFPLIFPIKMALCRTHT